MSRTAFVTIAGRTNAGKSSLLNALVGEKIAAVSARPQTTRTKITGVLTRDKTQYVFMDTPLGSAYHKGLRMSRRIIQLVSKIGRKPP